MKQQRTVEHVGNADAGRGRECNGLYHIPVVSSILRCYLSMSWKILLYIAGAATLVFAGSDDIRLNQLGFCVHGPKTAIVKSPQTWYFSIRSPGLEQTFYRGELSSQTSWTASDETLKVAMFPEFTRSGEYVLYVEGSGASFPFKINDNIYREVTRGLLRGFYYQRASTGLSQTCAGKWSRAGGHYDGAVIIHPSAASDPSKPGARRAGETYPSPKGWYDAGDYGKYVVNAGITTYQLLLLYNMFSEYYGAFGLNIPESGNDLPDILDEIKWELDWLLTMQDPADGGVYHKVTDKIFIGDLSPSDANETRYFLGKGAAATFDFTSVMAMASRIYRPARPAFADSCLAAAKYAWEWATAHPDSAFKNPSDVVTGAYGDNKISDEYMWASCELFITTGDSAYFLSGKDKSKENGVPDWKSVGILGYYSLALIKQDTLAKSKILQTADVLVKRTETLPYRTSISTEFYWGSNGVVANQGVCMLIAYLLTGKYSYLDGAIHACDYLMGRNATGYCFVTGFGSKSPMRPHHRPSTADGISPPVPGLLVGGVNSQSRSGESCTDVYPEPRARAYLDNNCSFTTNEVAINWNAPAAFLAGGIDAVLNSGKYDLREFGSQYVDTLSPGRPQITLVDIAADRATVAWRSAEPSVTTITYGIGRDMVSVRRIHFSRNDSGKTILMGLRPATVYYFSMLSVDNNGNYSSVADSFLTAASDLYISDLYGENRAAYPEGTSPVISFEAPDGINAQLVYGAGGIAFKDTVPFIRSGSKMTATVPAAGAGNAGIIYSVKIDKGAVSLFTPEKSLVPDMVTIALDTLTRAKRYEMISVPGIYNTKKTDALFSGFFGDTAQWRFFGFNPVSAVYVPFDSLRSGLGGWLYHEKSCGISVTAAAIAPDSLYPLVLHEGWNCIGIPYTFPIYWDNSMIDYSGALLQITDTVALRFVRRQFFRYADTTPDKLNNGSYITNRQLTSHVYDNSVQLLPWRAYWVYAEKDSVVCLLNPSPEKPAGVLTKAKNAGAAGWVVSLELKQGGITEGPLVFGFSEQAQIGYDPLDVPKPPSIASKIRAAFMHNDWATRSKSFVADIVPYNIGGSHTWVFDIASEDASMPVTINWEITGEVNGTIYLCDELTKTVCNIREGGKAVLPAAGVSLRKVSIVWSQEAVSNQAFPSGWHFSVFPGTTCRLSYTVPYNHDDSKAVAIDIFDIRGCKVATPVHQKRMPGSYTALWDGHAASGAVTVAGYYIARISNGKYSKSIGFQVLR